jgi:hypothetical protein
MKSKIVLVLFIVSLVFNVLVAAALVSAARIKPRYISYNDISDSGSGGSGGDYIASAAIVSTPYDGWSEISFGVIELGLVAGSKAHLQYSVMRGREQSNWQLLYLYDPDVVSIEYTISGVLISAKAEGEALLQIVTQDGIKTVALVRVRE